MNNMDFECVEIIYEGQALLVSKGVADFFIQDEHYMLAQQQKKKRYISNKELIDGSIEDLMWYKPCGFEDELIQNLERQKLREVISALPDTQKRRLIAYFFEERTYRGIAEREGVNEKSVRDSISSAIKKIKKYLIDTPSKRF